MITPSLPNTPQRTPNRGKEIFVAIIRWIKEQLSNTIFPFKDIGRMPDTKLNPEMGVLPDGWTRSTIRGGRDEPTTESTIHAINDIYETPTVQALQKEYKLDESFLKTSITCIYCHLTLIDIMRAGHPDIQAIVMDNRNEYHSLNDALWRKKRKILERTILQEIQIRDKENHRESAPYNSTGLSAKVARLFYELTHSTQGQALWVVLSSWIGSGLIQDATLALYQRLAQAGEVVNDKAIDIGDKINNIIEWIDKITLWLAIPEDIQRDIDTWKAHLHESQQTLHDTPSMLDTISGWMQVVGVILLARQIMNIRWQVKIGKLSEKMRKAVRWILIIIGLSTGIYYGFDIGGKIKGTVNQTVDNTTWIHPDEKGDTQFEAPE